ncbi:polyphosphate polymerase domain-containing protein [Butyrivibrio proteoclasticus]|uniref:polyphosphate polymerase domain-containing protein n=1 Tax=Butyrivibrio proteoclasticus TaxID=43305 RepID=UPI00047E8C09|nr:polyphosphate polymerase domain-containing protein [Butyrivibrio proteoclasticus]
MKEPKFRHELKYLCSDAELKALRVRLQHVLTPDPHADDSGKYYIRSMYFDDYDNSCYNENEDGVDVREKWRVRTYGCSDQTIKLECKRKEQGMIQKKACKLTREQFGQLCDPHSRILPRADYPELLNRFILLKRTKLFHPSTIVSYERTPFICDNGNVRVTFDRNITSSTQFDDFFVKELKQRPIMERGRQLLEVKYDEYIPDYIFHAIQSGSMQQTTFSKYFLCRQYSI